MAQKFFNNLITFLAIVIVIASCKKEDSIGFYKEGYIKYAIVVKNNGKDTTIQDTYSVFNSPDDSWIAKNYYNNGHKIGFYRYSETFDSYIYLRFNLDSLYQYTHELGELRINLTIKNEDSTNLFIRQNRTEPFFVLNNLVYNTNKSRINGEFSFEKISSDDFIQSVTGSFDVKLYLTDHAIEIDY
jgi:hypothetical protein